MNKHALVEWKVPCWKLVPAQLYSRTGHEMVHDGDGGALHKPRLLQYKLHTSGKLGELGVLLHQPLALERLLPVGLF